MPPAGSRKPLVVLTAAATPASLVAAGAGGRSLADRTAEGVFGAIAWHRLAALADVTAANGRHRVSRVRGRRVSEAGRPASGRRW